MPAAPKICEPLHGDKTRTALLVFKYLLPGILMIPRGSSDIAPRHRCVKIIIFD